MSKFCNIIFISIYVVKIFFVHDIYDYAKTFMQIRITMAVNI